METEITKKIRTAIENKLIECDAFVDKELPEYIMVMVANKKTKEQMDDDLSLFLGKKVGKFTNWLLKMLQVEKHGGAVAATAPGGDAVKSTKTGGEGTTINHPSDEDDILALDAQEQETDEFLKKELGEDGGSNVHSKLETLVIEEQPISKIRTSVVIRNVGGSGDDKDTGRVTAKEVFQKQSEALVKSPSIVKRIQSKSTVISSVKIPVANEPEEAEYDPLNPSISVKSVASKVLTPEKRFNLPQSSQANGLMLLKAVNEANKSVLSEKKLEEVYNPTPIKVLVSHANHREQQSKPLSFEYKPSPIVKTVYMNDDDDEKKEYVPQPFVSWHHRQEDSFASVKEPMCGDDIPETLGRKVVYKTRNIISDAFYKPNRMSCNGGLKIKPGPRPVSPHFVVTLDGYDSKSRKRSLSSLSQNDESDKEDIENMDIPLSPEFFDEPTPKKSKPLEKCRFWPSCKNGDNCDFHHPTTPCKAFPNCKFGDKCFYVHPKCKFDVLCTRKDCPYTHTCRKEFPVSKKIQIPARNAYPVKFTPAPQTYGGSSPQCKFFPNCTAFKCPYFHPKPCRYGTDCQSPSCTFIHPMFPSPNQLKWKAESI